ncbi:hypothetical protein HK097_009156 [Rhizophlyctis rosea]|uniref:Uncharacterized protein n=1 Tax=Rhizophlyctis rosea TaxID=64517 RepID=A0AAD5SHG4_9FUNG|nr:hypothetical protein HK097_009156 [Rhizophlyctis rosea]
MRPTWKDQAISSWTAELLHKQLKQPHNSKTKLTSNKIIAEYRKMVKDKRKSAPPNPKSKSTSNTNKPKTPPPKPEKTSPMKSELGSGKNKQW